MRPDSQIKLLLHLADNALVLGQRNSEWTGHGPILEQDIAISNIALDQIGHARYFYQYAAELMNENGNTLIKTQQYRSSHSEDSLAYLRDPDEFLNLLIVELPRGDWAFTLLRQFFVSSFQKYYFIQLANNRDQHIGAIARKAIKEIEYHVKWSGEWVIRLGDGTEESRRRLLAALSNLWSYTGEFFETTPFELQNEIFTDPLRDQWQSNVVRVMEEATMLTEFSTVVSSAVMQTGGKNGNHTTHLTEMLNEMQVLQRTYPGCEW